MQAALLRAVVAAMLPLRGSQFRAAALETITQYAAGATNQATARVQLREALQTAGYQPDPEDEDSIKDLSSEERLNLTLDIAHNLANAARDFLQNSDPAVLEAFPAQELYPLESRDAEPDWPTRWSAAGGTFFQGESDYTQGRMIALNNDPIWEAISDLGLPFPPFALGSGMWLRAIDWNEAKELGLVTGDENPQAPTFDLGPATAERLADALRKRIVDIEDQESNRRTDPLNYGTGEDLLNLALGRLCLSLAWTTSRLGASGLLDVFEEGPEVAESPTPDTLAEVRALADKAVERGLGDSPECLAGAYRGLARIYTGTGDRERALHCEQQATAHQQEAIRLRVDFLIRRASSYDLLMTAEELLAYAGQNNPEARTQVFALVQRATDQGLGDKYNLRPKAHRILACLYEQTKELDKAEANRAQYLESADGPLLLKDAQDRISSIGDKMDRETAAPILDLLTKAVEKLPPDRRNLQGDAYRATAEVLEAIGEKAQAAEYYECALQMNPKIPVNKRLASLKKALPPA